MGKDGQDVTKTGKTAPDPSKSPPTGGTPGRATAGENTDGAVGGPSYKKPSLFGAADVARAEETGKVEGIRDVGVARLTLDNPTWDPNAVVTVNGKEEKGGWVEATATRNAPGTQTKISEGVSVDKRMVAGTETDGTMDNPKLQSGDLGEDDLEALTVEQVGQVNPLGSAPRNIIKKAMHESWHHAKHSLLTQGTNKEARQMLMAKLWEFRQWHHNMILQRTQNHPDIGKEGLTEWKAAGSTTLTSDIDVNLKGAKTELAVSRFNELFKADGFKHEAGVVYDVNVYAVDFMHKGTFQGRAEMPDGSVRAYSDFGKMGPHPSRVSAKEGEREGNAAGGVGTENTMLEQRMVKADADLQRVWSLVKMRLYMTGDQWASYVRSSKLEDSVQSAVALRYNSYMKELSDRMANGAKLVTDANAAKDTGFKMLDKLAAAKAGPHGDAENVKMEASNRLYEEKLLEMAELRTHVQTQIKTRQGMLTSQNSEDAEALDAAIDGNLAMLRDLISECAMFSNEAYVTDGAVNHAVVGLQSKIDIRQTRSESLHAFNENVGDSLKEIARHSETLGEAAYKAGKYLWRMADAAQNLGISETILATQIKKLYAAGNKIANQIKGGDDSQDVLDTKAGAVITADLGITTPDELMAHVRKLGARVAASVGGLDQTGQDRAAPVRVNKT